MVQVDLIVSSDLIITMDANRRMVNKGAVAICGNTIVAIDAATLIRERYSASVKLDLGTDVLLPGFINGHTHSAMSLLRGFGDNAPLESWLHTIFPLEKRLMSRDFSYWGAILALREMIRGGITTMVDMYWQVDAIAQACQDMGMRAIVGSTLLHHDHELDVAVKFIQQWKGNDLITPACAPHSPSEMPLSLLVNACNAADEYDVPLLLHIDETRECVKKVRDVYNMSAIELLSKHNVLHERLILAHAVHTSPEDLQKIAAAGVGIVHCPTSNMKLASGIAPLVEMLKAGCAVGLGTDGAASNNSLNMIAEMKVALLLQRVHTGQADCLDAMTALECATIRGAQAIHKDHEIGSIEAGKKADIISIALRHDHQLPSYEPVSTIVFASGPCDVNTVIINGVVRVQDGILKIDEDLARELSTHVMSIRAKVIALLKDNNQQ